MRVKRHLSKRPEDEMLVASGQISISSLDALSEVLSRPQIS
jgi:hypothetical protein